MYAVGDGGLVLHFDGDDWEPLTTPTTEELVAISGDSDSPTDFWVSGRRNTILRWNGVAFENEDPNNEVNLTGLTQRILSVHRDGADLVATTNARGTWFKRGTWHRVRKPNGSSRWNRLFTLTPGGTLFAAGSNGSENDGGGFRLSDSILTEYPDDSGLTGAGNVAWASNDGDVYGYFGSSLKRFTGATWLDLTGSPDSPTSIWAEAEDNVYVTSSDGRAHRYNGSSWTEIGGVTAVNAVWGSGQTVFFVGKTGTVVDKNGAATTVTSTDGTMYEGDLQGCLLYTSPSPRDATLSRMPSSA